MQKLLLLVLIQSQYMEFISKTKNEKELIVGKIEKNNFIMILLCIGGA